MRFISKLLLTTLILAGFFNINGQTKKIDNKDVILTDWQLKSSLTEKTTGEDISTGKFNKDKWYPVQVPTTVLRGLVKNGVYPDPHLDMNNYLIPDASDAFNKENNLGKFSYLPGKENPWKDPYWFRTEFKIPAEFKGKQAWLNFNGINYRAEVWLNGKMIADSAQMAGMFQRFKYNITSLVNEGTNYLAVKIFQVDHPGKPGTQFKIFGGSRGPAEDLFKDLTLKISGGWDCAMTARDRNMGIYQDVYLHFTDDVDIINPYIITDLPLPDTTSAALTISATLFNTSNKVQTGILKGKIDLITDVDMATYIKKLPGKMNSITFEKEVQVPANDTITITFTPRDFAQLNIKNPYLWWPNGYGEQYLHNLELSFEKDKKVSVVKNQLFGIREVSSTLKELNGDYGRIFWINGQRIYSKGGWIQPDILLDQNKKRLYDEARLLAASNVNTVGNEDMPSPPEDYVEALDKYGLLWWEVFYQCWTTVPGSKAAYFPLDHQLAIQNERDIILRYRNCPSLTVWCAENENTPGPDLYFNLKYDLAKFDQTRVFLPTTSTLWDWKKLTPYIAPDMPVGTTDEGAPDYTWAPPAYFFDKINEVYQQMFRNELGMPAVPTLSSLKKMFFNPGADKSNEFFPLDSVWAEHGVWDGDGYAFKAYDKAIRDLYGFNSKSIEEYARISQFVNAEGYRAMFEAAGSRMWDITTGVMLWKLNAAYPEVLWQIYDWFLNPNSAYYFSKKALEPLHVQLNANDNQVSVINNLRKNENKLTVKARIYDSAMNVKWEREERINIKSDSYQEVFKVPQFSDISTLYFVKLQLVNEKGEIVSDNVYWQSSKTPADYSGLAKLKEVKPDMSVKVNETKDEYQVVVKLKNTSKEISFMNRLAVVKKGTKEEILPSFWEDNYITLFPGEEKAVKVSFSRKDVTGSDFSVILDNNM
jgi:exo-1,4-beta-D-glucosaminidase